jgi:unsaturated rhamnogalacturonyl hydrolase
VRIELIDRYIERLLEASTPDAPAWNLERILRGDPPQWNYVDGCMMTALWELYTQTWDERLAVFVRRFLDYYIDDTGTPLGYKLEDYNLDCINGGRVLFDIYASTGNEKYKRAIDLLRRQLVEQPRTKEGSFWHKLIYPNQVWLDGLYMAQVFAVRWALGYGGRPELGDIARQFATVRARLWMPEKALYCHGYDETREIFWAEQATGRSKNVWLRAVGWFLAALADVLGYWQNPALAAHLKEAAEGLLPHMDKATGMFYQVVDAGSRSGNYLETSGSAMAAYAFLKGARLGALPEEYRAHGRRVFEGICERRLSVREDGLNLSGICLVAGLGPEGNTRRDGTFEYYVSEPVVENDAKGVAPFLMCYTEIMRL